MPDHYQVLGVERTATAEQIKQAYRREAVKNHPDRNPGDKEAESRFRIASEAYRTLSDDLSRARYDKTLSQRVHTALQQMVTRPRQAEYTKNMAITLEEAVLGCTKAVTIGFRKVSFGVPAGIMSGTRVRVNAKEFIVYVNVEVAPHSSYVLDGRDVIVTTTAPFPLFVVGGSVAVQTPRGQKDITLEPLTRSGVRKRFAGEGCSTLDGTRKGDLVVVVEVEVRQHSSEQLRRLQEYASALQLPVPKKRWQRF